MTILIILKTILWEAAVLIYESNKMKIVSKSQAMKLKSELNLKITRFCTGKYKWTGKASDYIGKEVSDIDNVYAVYVERRVDSDGPYARMMSVSGG